MTGYDPFYDDYSHPSRHLRWCNCTGCRQMWGEAWSENRQRKSARGKGPVSPHLPGRQSDLSHWPDHMRWYVYVTGWRMHGVHAVRCILPPARTGEATTQESLSVID